MTLAEQFEALDLNGIQEYVHTQQEERRFRDYRNYITAKRSDIDMVLPEVLLFILEQSMK